MTFFPILEYDQLQNPQARATYDEIKEKLGFGMVPNLFKSMGSAPGFLDANWRKFYSVVLTGKLPRTLKEMIGVAISQANNSQYALQVHLHGLSALGISEEVLRLLVQDFDGCPLPEREKQAIRFGLLAATNPSAITQAEYDKLRGMGLDSAEIYEIIATANLFTGVNQYTDSIKLPIDSL